MAAAVAALGLGWSPAFVLPLVAAPLEHAQPSPVAPDWLVDGQLTRELEGYLQARAPGMLLRRLEDFPIEQTSGDQVRALKAAALLQLGDAVAARDLWQTFDHRRPPPPAGVRFLAEAYLERGDWHSARKVLQAGLMSASGNAELLRLMARAEAAGGRSSQAAAYLSLALRSARHEPAEEAALRISLASTLSSLNRHQQAREVLAALDDTEVPPVLLGVVAARDQASRGQYAEALERLAGVSDIPAVVQTRAHVHLLSGEPGRAWKTLRSAGLDEGPLAALVHLLAEPQADAGDRLSGEPSAGGADVSPVLQALLAMAAGERSRVEGALARAGLPLAEMVRHPAFLQQLDNPALARELALAHFCLDQGYLDQARAHAARLQAAQPEHVLPLVLEAEAHRLEGNLPGAIGAYRRALDHLPESVGLRFQLAQLLARAGDVPSALEAYRKLLDTHPDFVAGQLAYGELLSQHHSWKEAGEAWAWALNFKPDAAPLLLAHARAQIEVGAGESPELIIDPLAGLEWPPGELLRLRSRASQLRGETELAAAELYAAVQANPRADWLADLATLQRQSGRQHMAKQLDCQAALLSLSPADWLGEELPTACAGG